MVSSDYHLSSKQKELLLHLGEVILGVPRDDLPDEFVSEAELFIQNLDDFLISDLNRLLNLFNSRLTIFLFMFRIKKFTQLSDDQKRNYFEKWVYSRLGLLRTGATTLRALVGWSYYSIDAEWNEMDYPGITIGREHVTPTLLKGQDEPWKRPNQEGR